MQKDVSPPGWSYLKNRPLSYHDVSSIAQVQTQLIFLDSRIHGDGNTNFIVPPTLAISEQPLQHLHALLWSHLRIFFKQTFFFVLNICNRKKCIYNSLCFLRKWISKKIFFFCRWTGNKKQRRKIRKEGGLSQHSRTEYMQNLRETVDPGIVGCKNAMQFSCACCKITLSLAILEHFHTAYDYC